MDINEKFNKVLELKKSIAKKVEIKISLLKEKLNEYPQDSRVYEAFSQQIRDTERNLRQINDIIEFMRPSNDKDINSRLRIYKEFPKVIDETFPDGFPIVFHGTNNIGTVREILKTGGLLTPEQRNESRTSFASAIDVTYKSNILVSCEFADAGSGSFLPYGAIFAFKPKEDEIERVISTGQSSEVAQGVDGVSFRDQPQRLYGIITTPENIEKVKEWCEQYGIDSKKVFTHSKFNEKFKDLKLNIEV